LVRLADLPPDVAAGILNLPLPQFDSTPWTPAPPVKQARVALISTAGLHRRSDPKFVGGATDYRPLPADLDYADLVMSHVSVNFDRSGYQQDVNVVFPLELLRELGERGEVASLARWHYSFMGATDPTRMAETGAQVGKLLRADGVTAALLVPV